MHAGMGMVVDLAHYPQKRGIPHIHYLVCLNGSHRRFFLAILDRSFAEKRIPGRRREDTLLSLATVLQFARQDEMDHRQGFFLKKTIKK